MNNLKLYLPLVNGSMAEFDFNSGKELIQELTTDDWSCPPKSMIIEAISESGIKVTVSIPYDNESNAFVRIEDKPI